MASSMLSGDRRWAPTRKGMTVLGKVPKPINLPSQRLENHGLDPNVEIVPKGTLTWGSRPSPTTPNAWGLSNHSSPNADGSVDSPTCFNGRPSSSGSGTRPSTAGSDRSSEHVASAWKSNSRPSSASGLLVSNQTQLAATRPQSADTRPGSSQLSRFADSAIGHPGPWGSTGSTQKLGPASPVARDFSLSSGDFPTLGSEKNSELQYEPEIHAATIHAPTTLSTEKDRLELSQVGPENINVHSDKENVNNWKTETLSNHSDTSASNDSWHGNLRNMQLAPNINPAQPPSNPWHGHPRNPSDGAWYQGVPSGGPYRPPPTASSGNHQSDPFTYCSSRMPARLDPSSHSAPRAGGHPTRYQNENGEGFHAHPPPEPFMVPTIPIIPVRPGMYCGPVPYEGHYAPPAGFGGPNVRERSVMGFAPGPPVYGQFPNQSFHQGPVQMPLRPSGHAQLSDDKIANTRQPDFASGQYKVLLKHHNHPVGTDSEGSRDQTTTSMTLSLEKDSNVEAVRGHGLEQKVIKDELKTPVSGGTSNSNLRGCCQEVISANLFERPSERAGDNLLKKVDSSSASAEVNPLATKSSKLFEKIETLNNKARVTDGRFEGSLTKEEKTKRVDDGKSTHDDLRNSVPSASSFGSSSGKELPISKPIPHDESAVSSGKELPILKPIPHDESAVSSRITLECRSVKALPILSETYPSRFSMSGSSDANTKAHADHRRTRDTQGKGDHLSKSRMDVQGNNQWAKQLSRKELVSPNSSSIRDGLPTEEFSSSQDHSKRPSPIHMEKLRDEANTSSLDSVDYKAQRAKMKEIAIQRAKQLQQEEEERNREQKAKALAKLEELNRRCNSSLSIEVGTESNACDNTSGIEVVTPSDEVPKRHDGTTPPITSEPNRSYSDKATLKHKGDLDMSNQEDPNLLLTYPSLDVGSSQQNAHDACKNKGTKTQYFDSPEDCQCSGGLVASADQMVSSKNDPADCFRKNNIQYHDNSNSKKRQAGHRRKQNIPLERNLEDKAAASIDIASSETSVEATTETILGGKSTSVQSNETCNSTTQQRRNGSSSKNKNKSEESLQSAVLTSTVAAKGILEKPANIQQHDQRISEDEYLLAVSKSEKVGTSQNLKEVIDSSEQALLQAAGGSVKAATNHWKSNPPRRPSRNGQSKLVDKNDNVVWAPVKPGKVESAEESHGGLCHAHVVGNSSTSSTGISNPGNIKSRRAEIQRYVPKVVVKDATQEGNFQVPDCQTPVEMAVTDNTILNDSKKDGLIMSDSVNLKKNSEQSRTNRHGKNHGVSVSWRQRSSDDGSVDVTPTGMNLSDRKQLEDASSSSHEVKSSDILVTPNVTSKEPMGVSNTKEQGNTSKSRRQMQKVHKVVPADTKDSTSDITGKIEVQSIALDWNGTHMNSTAAESLNLVERAKSQWKPKSRTISSHSNQQDRGSVDEKVASQTITQDKESPIITERPASASDKYIVGKAADMDGRRLQRGEKKELALENHNDKTGHDAGHYQEQAASILERQRHGMRHMKGKDMRYGGRFHKGLDNSYGDTGRQNFPTSGDRQRQASHYEYQRIEAHNSSDQFQSVVSGTGDGPSGSTATVSKFREKAQGQKKSGAHFYVRSSVSHQDGKTSGRQS